MTDSIDLMTNEPLTANRAAIAATKGMDDAVMWSDDDRVYVRFETVKDTHADYLIRHQRFIISPTTESADGIVLQRSK